MPLIKFDTIDSTNDYLKQLSKDHQVQNYMIVMADEQTKGKGQMGAKWISEKGKNLTMSMLVKEVSLKNENLFILNIIAALSVLKALNLIKIPNISIKWPNDIMADSKKVAGILIENIIKPDGSFNSVIGIGLNINQTNFDGLPQATSLLCIQDEIYDIEAIGLLIGRCIMENMQLLAKKPDSLWEEYHQSLYKLNYPSPFEDKIGNRFMGIIKKVTRDGKLEVILDDDSITHFEVKEVKMLY